MVPHRVQKRIEALEFTLETHHLQKCHLHLCTVKLLLSEIIADINLYDPLAAEVLVFGVGAYESSPVKRRSSDEGKLNEIDSTRQGLYLMFDMGSDF